MIYLHIQLIYICPCSLIHRNSPKKLFTEHGSFSFNCIGLELSTNSVYSISIEYVIEKFSVLVHSWCFSLMINLLFTRQKRFAGHRTEYHSRCDHRGISDIKLILNLHVNYCNRNLYARVARIASVLHGFTMVTFRWIVLLRVGNEHHSQKLRIFCVVTRPMQMFHRR